MSNINICQEFKKVGSRLLSKNVELLLATRKNPTKNKPAEFLMLVDSETKKRSFISSLYLRGCKDNLCKYKLDYKGQEFFLFMNSDYAKIYKSA